MGRDVIHPLTEEPLEDEEAALAAIREADQFVAQRINEAYAEIRPVRDRLQELRAAVPPAKMPSARYRTDAQMKIARCPRCGTQLTADTPTQTNQSP